MNIPKTAKLGLACAAALSYSVIPTYLLKYRWIFRSRQRASREEKVLYLTFDDGPDTVYTNILLDFLEKEQIPAAFFMVAGSARKHPGIVERMRKSGYQVGIHSLSHESAMLSGPGRTGRDVKESKKDYGEDGYCSEMVQTTVGTSEPGKSVLDTEAASESGILGCDGTGLVSERDPGQYLQ